MRVRTKQVAFHSGYNGKYTKEVFKVHRAWHSPNTWLTMVHGQVFRIIIWQSSIKKASPIHHPGLVALLVEPWESS